MWWIMKKANNSIIGERSYKCEHCASAFCQLSNLIVHKYIHTGLISLFLNLGHYEINKK